MHRRTWHPFTVYYFLNAQLQTALYWPFWFLSYPPYLAFTVALNLLFTTDSRRYCWLFFITIKIENCNYISLCNEINWKLLWRWYKYSYCLYDYLQNVTSSTIRLYISAVQWNAFTSEVHLPVNLLCRSFIFLNIRNSFIDDYQKRAKMECSNLCSFNHDLLRC